jgi:hypothetical protein
VRLFRILGEHERSVMNIHMTKANNNCFNRRVGRKGALHHST